MPVACRPGEKRYKKWAEDVSKIFGGLDIFALNIIQTRRGAHHILGMQVRPCAASRLRKPAFFAAASRFA